MRTRHATTWIATALLATAVLAGCSQAGSDADSEGGASAAIAPESGADAAERLERSQGRTNGEAAFDSDALVADGAANVVQAEEPATERAVISTGTVSLRGDDVGAARFEVQRVSDEMGGQIGEEETETDDEGEVRRSRLVLRVPSDKFDAAMSALSEVDELVRSTRSSEDVTTQVIDVDARVRAQAASLRRVELLLDQATTMKDVVSIERQLTQRQAELDSLRSQQAWLKDQTSLSTITVHLQRSDEPVEEEEPSEAGFLPGLKAGWAALVSVSVGAATALGAVLPFAVLLTVLLTPIVLVVRRRRAARPALSEPAAE